MKIIYANVMPPRKCLLVTISLFVGTSGTLCRNGEYKAYTGECCSMCDKGSVVQNDCTSLDGTKCSSCVEGISYMDEENGRNTCIPCNTCDAGQGLVYLHKCTTTRNAFCIVKGGFYCASYSKSGSCSSAIKHSTCSPGKYLKGQGTNTSDTQCEDCPDGYFSANGINCTVWTKCNSDQQKTAEGTNAKDTVCEDKPVRYTVAAVSALVLAAAVFGLWYKGLRNPLKIAMQETGEPLRPAIYHKGDGTGCAETLLCPYSLQEVAISNQKVQRLPTYPVSAVNQRTGTPLIEEPVLLETLLERDFCSYVMFCK